MLTELGAYSAWIAQGTGPYDAASAVFVVNHSCTRASFCAVDGPVDARTDRRAFTHVDAVLEFGVPTGKMVAAAGFEPATKGL